MLTRARWTPVIALALSCIGLATTLSACPLCEAPVQTLSEQLDMADAVVLVKWLGGTLPDEETAGTTEFEVVEVTRQNGKLIKPGDKISLVRYRAANPGDLFLLTGTKARTLEWNPPTEVTESSYEFLKNLPELTLPTTERLRYFVTFLEHPESMVANDAYGEFAKAPWADIVKLSDELPRKKLRQWVGDPDVAATRLGLYGLLLGLCGDAQDAELMAQRIVDPTNEDFRLGIDGVMSGYLLITRNQGLELLAETKLRPKYQQGPDGQFLLDKKGNKRLVPFSETYAAMQALRFMWTYGDNRISKDDLRGAMRVLLDRPELTDLVIADLARWKDWSVQDHLVQLYGQEGYDIPSIKRAIVRYLYYCSKDVDEGVEELPEHAVKAKAHLAELEKRDPKTVSEAKRFLLAY